MKKCLLVLFSILICCLSCSACFFMSAEDTPQKESGEEAATQDAATGGAQSEPEELIYGLNDAAVFRDLKFTATEFKESRGEGFFEPKEGNVFVGVKFEIENTSEKEQTVSSLLLFEGYADDVKADYSFSAVSDSAFSEGTLDGSIAPGKKLIGWYALEVSADWQTIELVVQANWLSQGSATFVFTK